jgi:hypothetical protein
VVNVDLASVHWPVTSDAGWTGKAAEPRVFLLEKSLAQIFPSVVVTALVPSAAGPLVAALVLRAAAMLNKNPTTGIGAVAHLPVTRGGRWRVREALSFRTSSRIQARHVRFSGRGCAL